jgi:hypothetical protein
MGASGPPKRYIIPNELLISILLFLSSVINPPCQVASTSTQTIDHGYDWGCPCVRHSLNFPSLRWVLWQCRIRTRNHAFNHSKTSNSWKLLNGIFNYVDGTLVSHSYDFNHLVSHFRSLLVHCAFFLFFSFMSLIRPKKRLLFPWIDMYMRLYCSLIGQASISHILVVDLMLTEWLFGFQSSDLLLDCMYDTTLWLVADFQ